MAKNQELFSIIDMDTVIQKSSSENSQGISQNRNFYFLVYLLLLSYGEDRYGLLGKLHLRKKNAEQVLLDGTKIHSAFGPRSFEIIEADLGLSKKYHVFSFSEKLKRFFRNLFFPVRRRNNLLCYFYLMKILETGCKDSENKKNEQEKWIEKLKRKLTSPVKLDKSLEIVCQLLHFSNLSVINNKSGLLHGVIMKKIRENGERNVCDSLGNFQDTLSKRTKVSDSAVKPSDIEELWSKENILKGTGSDFKFLFRRISHGINLFGKTNFKNRRKNPNVKKPISLPQVKNPIPDIQVKVPRVDKSGGATSPPYATRFTRTPLEDKKGNESNPSEVLWEQWAKKKIELGTLSQDLFNEYLSVESNHDSLDKSKKTINSFYREAALVFHPDKQKTEREKETAHRIFISLGGITKKLSEKLTEINNSPKSNFILKLEVDDFLNEVFEKDSRNLRHLDLLSEQNELLRQYKECMKNHVESLKAIIEIMESYCKQVDGLAAKVKEIETTQKEMGEDLQMLKEKVYKCTALMIERFEEEKPESKDDISDLKAVLGSLEQRQLTTSPNLSANPNTFFVDNKQQSFANCTKERMSVVHGAKK